MSAAQPAVRAAGQHVVDQDHLGAAHTQRVARGYTMAPARLGPRAEPFEPPSIGVARSARSVSHRQPGPARRGDLPPNAAWLNPRRHSRQR